MRKIIIFILIIFLILSTGCSSGVSSTNELPKKIEPSCPRGQIDDKYPGMCALYIDEKKDGFCDLG